MKSNSVISSLCLAVSALGIVSFVADASEQKANTVRSISVPSSFSLSPLKKIAGYGGYYSLKLKSSRFFSYASLLLHEQVEIEERNDREVIDGVITVQVYDIQTEKLAVKPIRKIRVKARSGEFLYDGKVYRAYQANCCDMSRHSIFFDLTSGDRMFSTTADPLSIVYDHEVIRFIGYDDGEGGESPPEMKTNKNILGILYYSGTGITTKKLAVIQDEPNEGAHRHQQIVVSIKDFSVRAEDQVVSAYRHGFSRTDKIRLDVKMDCRCKEDESFSITIANDDFLLNEVRLSKGIKLKRLD